MVAKRKLDEMGDSTDLQALFDDIAAGKDGESKASAPVVPPPTAAVPTPAPAAPAAAPAPAPSPKPVATGGATDDDDELQALFDAEHDKFAATSGGAEVDLEESGERDVVMFNRIGKMTRKLHDMLIELGLDSKLQEVADSIPDARQRLTYVAQMTEQAASRVLNATDVAQPLSEQIETVAESLRQRWDKVFVNQVPVDEFKVLAGETHTFLRNTVEGSRTVSAQLLEIMMAQDFQDLTGQVIKKVVDLAQSLEGQLLNVLIESAPEEMSEKASSLLNGPVINAEGRDDVVTGQGQVDDLLASLGF